MIPLTAAQQSLARRCLREAFTLADLEVLEAARVEDGLAPLLEMVLAVGIAWGQRQHEHERRFAYGHNEGD